MSASPTTIPIDGTHTRRARFDELVAESTAFGGDRWRDPAWGGIDAWSSIVSARQYRHLFDMVDRFVPAGGHVLDWGGGSGRVSWCLLREGYRVSAGDLVVPPLVDELGAFGGNRYDFTRLDGSTSLPYDDSRFDAVLSVGVLEHVPETGGDEQASLREIHRVLRPGAVFVCTHLPNRWSWIDFAARHLRRDLHHHVYRYTASDIRRMATEAGFELVSMGRHGMLPRNRAARLPAALSDTARGAAAFDAVDRALGRVLAPLVQNWFWVGRAA